MAAQHWFAATLGAALLAALISPLQILGLTAAWFWWPTWLIAPSPGALIYAGVMVTATAFWLLAGVPAALWERAAGASAEAGMRAWALAAGLLLAANLVWRFGA